MLFHHVFCALSPWHTYNEITYLFEVSGKPGVWTARTRLQIQMLHAHVVLISDVYNTRELWSH
jgi:hypothetical protein